MWYFLACRCPLASYHPSRNRTSSPRDLTGGWALLTVFFPIPLTQFFECVRDELGYLLKPFLLELAGGTVILGEIGLARGTPARPLCPWPMWILSDVFGLLTIVALWMLMIPKPYYVGPESAGSADEDD